MTDSTVDLYGKLSPEHRAHLDLLGPRYARFGGWTMKDDDGDGDSGDGGDDDDDDVVQLEPNELILVGGKKMKVSDLQRIAAREKREGKKAGQTALLKKLGFESLEDLEDALTADRPAPKDDDQDDKGNGPKPDDEAARRAKRRELDAEKRERTAAIKERRADLRGALRDAGVSRDDLDDAFAMLDRTVDDEYEDDDVEEAVEALQERRPALFGVADDDGTRRPPPPRHVAAGLPAGRPKRRNSGKAPEPGEEGRRRAAARGWIKQD